MKLKDLAAQLGVSQTTVSRALNGYPEVSEETRARVIEAAMRLGYRPNASALRLATGRAGAIGFVLEKSGELHASEFLIGMGQRLAPEEIDIVVSPLESDRDEADVYKRLAASQKVDAMVLHSPMPDDPRIDLLHDLDMPFIVHGRSEGAAPHAWLDIDNEGAFRQATAELLALGHRRIANINGPKGRSYVAHRDAGYREALADFDIASDPELMCYGIFSDEQGFRFANALLDLPDPPTAFLAGSMMTALGIFRAVRSHGLELGRDVSLIAHDDEFPYLNASAMVPAISTTRSSMRKAGIRIAELALEILAGRAPEDVHELWPVELVLRESTAPAPKR
ncbi:substrate-binding domain-containing protein [Pelagibacterium halotolerans]|uniref:substrate-binding domain-containing protein n=1 Tax=Pelagibacterium halotolerans TaxID=531813 RepID=UPI00384A6DA8